MTSVRAVPYADTLGCWHGCQLGGCDGERCGHCCRCQGICRVVELFVRKRTVIAYRLPEPGSERS